MSPIERCQEYISALESRLRWRSLGTGLAALGGAALGTTLLLVWWTNRSAFSGAGLFYARIALFLAVGLAFSFAVVLPLLRANRKRAAQMAEQAAPEFEQRLITLADDEGEAANPFRALLAREVDELAGKTPPAQVIGTPAIAGASLGGAALMAVLAWLILAGPGYIGYGASLLWAGTPPSSVTQPLYRLDVIPGNQKIRRGADQLVEAKLSGYEADSAKLFARQLKASRWDTMPMQKAAAGHGFQFVLAGMNESLEYYVEAGRLRSGSFLLTVVDLPAVKRVKVTYHFPGWTGMQVAVEEGGDLRAIEGTEAEVEVETDRPLVKGLLSFEGGARIPLEAKGGNILTARVPIRADGSYFVAAIEDGDAVRISEDYFIEAKAVHPPVVRVTRPGRDAKVSPIEEVTLEAESEADFTLEQMELHYSVNGAPEKAVNLLAKRGVRQARGSHLIALEEYRLSPGDLVSFYATARDARSTARTDIMFLEAQPFEREFSQSQTSGGMGRGNGQDQSDISKRQKEIIAATWNQLRDNARQTSAREDAEFLAGVQSKLSEQALSLAERMKSRELAGANQEFQVFSKEMETAAQAMKEATDQLKTLRWKEALPPEQRALQHLLRAEAVFREIQVAFGSSGRGGSGSASNGRDLENLFDLELDTEKNQYETGQSAMGQNQKSREVDEALKRLEELARRQEELAKQNEKNQQTAPQQRWAQEMLRREAEELKRQMEEMQRGQSSQGQSQSQGQSGQQRGQQQGRSLQGMAGASKSDPRLDRALEQLSRATDDMRRAGSQQGSAGNARRAADRLNEARDSVGGMRRQEAGQQVEDLARRAEQLAEQQKDFSERLKKAFPEGQSGDQNAGGPGKAEALADEKAGMQRSLERLESDMRDAVRDLAGSQRSASSKIREALGESQQNELRLRMKMNSEWIRKGMGAYVSRREQIVTQGLDKLKDQLKDAQGALGSGGEDRESVEKALAGLERLRGQLKGGEEGQSGQPGHSEAGSQAEGQRTQGSNPGQVTRALQEAQREVGELERGGGMNPGFDRDFVGAARRLQTMDPRRLGGNPRELDPVRVGLIADVEEMELQLRRKLESKGTAVRSGMPDKIPDGYADRVAEYFRRLSRQK
jgi:hypothetical protein